MSDIRTRRSIWRAVYLGWGLVGISPIILAVAASSTASLAGCQLDEGSVHECRVLGADIGPQLYTGFVLGWATLITVPASVAGAIATGVLHLATAWKSKR